MPDIPKRIRSTWSKPLPDDALEGTIQKAILSAVNRLPYARLWRNNVGMLKDATGKGVTYGLAKGSADLIGIVKRLERPEVRTGSGQLLGWVSGAPVDTFGIFVSLEVKRPGKKPTVDQLDWGMTVARLGGYWHVVSSVDGALAAVAHARGITIDAVRHDLGIPL